MTDPVIPSRDAWSAVQEMYRWWRSYKTQGAQNGQLGQAERRISRHPLRLVITTADIDPGEYGPAKFTTGAKGSEAVTGDAYQMFYRGTSDTDTTPLDSGTLCFAIWVPCDTLTGEQTGWELTPVYCPE